MPTQQEQELRLEVVLDDQAMAQLAQLRGEVQRLTGPQTQGGIEKLQKQAEALQQKLIPLYGSFSQVTGSIQILTRGLSPMALAITTLGVAAGAAAFNLGRFTEKMAELGRLARETAIPTATIKNMLDALERAGVPSEVREQYVKGISKDMADMLDESSQLVQSLRLAGRQGGAIGQENMDKHIAYMQSLARSGKAGEFATEVFRAIREVQDPLLDNPQRRRHLQELLQQLYRVGPDATRDIKPIKDATDAENETADRATKSAEEFERAIAEVKHEIGELLDEIVRVMGGIETLTSIAKSIADVLEGTVEFLKESEAVFSQEGYFNPLDKRFWEGTPEGGPEGSFSDRFGDWPPKVQKQSYTGEGFGGGLLMKARFEENTDQLEDDTKARHELTEQLRILNNFFRGGMGGGGGAPGSTTITTPDGAQIVTHPNDVIRVADALIKTPNASILAYDPSGPIYQPGVQSRAGPQYRLDLPYTINPETKRPYIPASERYRNPAAQYPSAAASEFGMQYWGETGSATGAGHRQYKTALFPTTAHGLAANFDNMYRLYAGKTADDIGDIWTGHISRGIPGIDPNRVITKEDLQNREIAIDIFKRMAFREKGGKTDVSDEDFQAGHAAFMDKVRREQAAAAPTGLAQKMSMEETDIAPIRRAIELEPGRNLGGLGGMRGMGLGQLLNRPYVGTGGSRSTTSLDGLDRAMGNEMSHKVEGTGKINVEVGGGAKNGGGDADLFKSTTIPRQTQMEPAGPERTSQVS